MGRPLPGSAEVRLAAYDVETGQYELGADGFVRQCGPNEVGMLLARVRASGPDTSTTQLRGVFSRGDAWLEIGDLFRKDADGDYWRIDNLSDVIHTASGPVFTGPIREALGTLPAVDLAVAYPLLKAGSERDTAVAAVTLQTGHKLHPRDLTAALGALPREQRPQVVQVVDEIPVTTWYRPITGPLRRAGIPNPADPPEGVQAWYLDATRDTYKPLTAAAHKRLAPQSA
jgi:putative long chain acyl-CoA synthase